MKKIFIDGKAGTTGLRIYERLGERADIQLLTLPEELRKDPAAKKEIINQSDVVFLCLPDAAAIESVALVENPDTVVIDTSTAHRTNPLFAYGFPEVDDGLQAALPTAKRIAVPGCHASGFIALTCKSYTDWESFAKRLDGPLSAFIQIYKPAYFERVGLRYINFVSRNGLDLSDTPFRELFQPQYLGLMADDSMNETDLTCCSCDFDAAIRNGCRAKIHAGPGRVRRNGEVKFIYDLDLYIVGNIPVNHAAGVLETLHAQAFPIFRGAITDTLHDALDPMPV